MFKLQLLECKHQVKRTMSIARDRMLCLEKECVLTRRARINLSRYLANVYAPGTLLSAKGGFVEGGEKCVTRRATTTIPNAAWLDVS